MDIPKWNKNIACMKKLKVVFTIIAIIMVCIVIGPFITNSFNKKPPTLQVITKDKTFCAYQSSYTWNWPGGGVAADSPSPYDMGKTQSASEVESNGTVILSVEKSLLKKYTVQQVVAFSLWLGSSQESPVYYTFKNNELSFKVPEKEGQYIYSVVLKYPQGISSYGFKLEVYDKANTSLSNLSTYCIDSDTRDKVEENLKIIMSSPKTSSNPQDYIEAHQNEYHNILKMGDKSLQYMLSLFKAGENSGLKSHIMMPLCIDLLGDRNNVKEGSYSSPKEWYEKLSPYTAAKLPNFEYETENKIESMVYRAALAKYENNKKDDAVVIVAPHIFGTYENGNELKIFTTVYYSEFNLYDKTISEQSGGIVPSAIIYTKNNDGTYSFKKYVEAMDGSDFQKSIEDFCKPRNDIAKEMMTHYGNYEDLFKLMKDNLVKYLNKNGLKNVKLKQNDGIIVPLT